MNSRRALQFNRNHACPKGVTDNELRAWNHVAAFDHDLGDVKYYTTLEDPADTTKTLGQRARAYLDSNCSQCHRPGGPTPLNMDFRAFVPQYDTHTVNVAPAAGDLN